MDNASVPSVDPPIAGVITSGGDRVGVSTLFSAVPKWWNERRKIIRITRENGVVTSEVVKDYDQLYKDEQSSLSKVLAELASSDDSPEAQQFLMDAWTAMAMYLANADDEDKANAVAVLQAIGSLISDDDATSEDDPSNPGSFNFSRRSDASALACRPCERAFATSEGLSNHMKIVHTSGKKD